MHTEFSAVELRKATTRSVIAIVLFMFVYLLLVAIGLGIAVGGAMAGIFVLSFDINRGTMFLAAALFIVSILMLILVSRFIAFRRKTDTSNWIRVEPNNEPKLFEMIKELSQSIGTKMPKAVYLSHDVNAAAIENPSFFGLFFPARKDLLIGLGLVNSASESELKAVIAHEFGHFSQKTMKVGSFVYQANLIIHNVLYGSEKQQIKSTLEELGAVGAIAMGLSRVVQTGFFWVLRKMYHLINIQNMGLSREMEFHADHVAVLEVGPESFKNVMLRLDISSGAMAQMLSFYSRKVESNVTSANLYSDHAIALDIFAQQNEIPLVAGLPLVNESQYALQNGSHIVYKDQWASHPPTLERIARAVQLPAKTNQNDGPAWRLFSDPERTQIKMTNILLAPVFEGRDVPRMESERFRSEFLDDTFPFGDEKAYHGYYNIRPLQVIDPKKVLEETAGMELLSVEQAFSNENKLRAKELTVLTSDSEILAAIASRDLQVKAFDFKGEKYPVEAAQSLREKLRSQIADLSAESLSFDKAVFRMFYQKASSDAAKAELIQKYTNLMDVMQINYQQGEVLKEVTASAQVMFQQSTMVGAKGCESRFRPVEGKLKKSIQALVDDPRYTARLEKTERDELLGFASSEIAYLTAEGFHQTNIHTLQSSLGSFQQMLARAEIHAVQNILKYQAGLA